MNERDAGFYGVRFILLPLLLRRERVSIRDSDD